MVNSNSSDSSIDQTFNQHGLVVGYTIKEKPSELSCNVISSIYPGFEGADLIV